MDSIDFARIIVEEVVDKNPPDSRLFLCGNGIRFNNLDESDEIWKAFVRYNIDAGGIKSSIVGKYWNLLSERALIKQRTQLLDKILILKGLKCYKDFTHSCPVKYIKEKGFVDVDMCYSQEFFIECPVVNLIQELSWHKKHHTFAKIIIEDAKRLLIENPHGKLNGNLNDIVNGILDKYPDNEEGKCTATKELLDLFKNIKGYGDPPKVITWFFSEFSSPVHQINQWPGLYYRKLNPVDTHVRRLMVRFGFVRNKEDSNEEIDSKLNELYPEEPRKLDFGLYRLGGEEGICGKTPNCELCKEKHSIIWENCKIPSLGDLNEKL